MNAILWEYWNFVFVSKEPAACWKMNKERQEIRGNYQWADNTWRSKKGLALHVLNKCTQDCVNFNNYIDILKNTSILRYSFERWAPLEIIIYSRIKSWAWKCNYMYTTQQRASEIRLSLNLAGVYIKESLQNLVFSSRWPFSEGGLPKGLANMFVNLLWLCYSQLAVLQNKTINVSKWREK